MKLEISFFVLFVVSQVYGQSSSPVFVTPYLPGNYQAAQNATKVSKIRIIFQKKTTCSFFFNFNNDKVTLDGYPYPSYAGYFTVNATYNSNTFFWYFPSQFNPDDAPVLVWYLFYYFLSIYYLYMNIFK